MAKNSIFRDALQVSREIIANLSDAQLDELMWDLLRAHANRCRADISQVVVNTEGKAKDDGCDGRSPKAQVEDDWFGAADTCWQFKAGSAGEPARLSGEVVKKIPSATLKAGERFVVVASGSVNGVKGETDRLELMRKEAEAAGLPSERIEVIGSERLAAWCNLHPAVAARFAGRPAGLWLLDAWANVLLHRAPWQSTTELDDSLRTMRSELDFSNSSVLHLHVKGPPGVGKTRFVLELCKGADWCGSLIYVDNATDHRVGELIDGATADMGIRLVLVADEVQREQLERLRNWLDRGNGRVRLVTIGQCASPDPARIPSIEIAPLGDEAMNKVVAGWHPSMPREHVDFVTRFAAGYVRLAWLTANAVAKESTIDVRALLDLEHIKEFFGRMLGGQSRKALYVVAVLSRIGWNDELENEGKAVAAHLGQNWTEVRESVDAFHRQFAIAPRGGRYRYISPKPLAIYLAVEAWGTFPELRTLPDVLPSEEAKEAYYERLGEIAANPQARKFARQELGFFLTVADFVEEQNAKRWSSLSSADPALATQHLLGALLPSSEAERRQIQGPARRDLVFALVKLAWSSQAFRAATLSLALLGESENETWANNASKEFINRFELVLGGTAVSYIERLAVVDELVKVGRLPLTRLAIKALARVGNRHHVRTHSGHIPGAVPEPEWRPRTGDEVIGCATEALQRLRALAPAGASELEQDLVAAAKELGMLLREVRPLRESVVQFFEAVREKYPDSREPLRRIIADVLSRERKYWNELSSDEIAEIEAMHARFEDKSLAGRLRQEVGPSRWEEDEADKPSRLKALAEGLIGSVDLVRQEWSWLTSGDAAQAWYLGEALAIADEAHALESTLPDLPERGHDLRVLGGYVSRRRIQAGNDWYDAWIDWVRSSRRDDMALVFEVIWRCGMTPHIAGVLASMIRTESPSEAIVQQLENGSWPVTLPTESLLDVLQALIEGGHFAVAIAVVDRRLKHDPTSAPMLEPLALQLVTNGEVIRRDETMSDYHWKEVALRLLPQHVGPVAAAIIAEQADRTSGTWFAEYSTAKEVLTHCVNVDPASVWRALVPRLSNFVEAIHFAIGFPSGLIDQMPVDDVLKWFDEVPKERACVIARLARKNAGNDQGLMAKILGKFGDDPDVGAVFFSARVTGTWVGPVSRHWAELAEELEKVAATTALPKLRVWAQQSVAKLRDMAEREVQHEEEEALRFQ